MPDGMLLIDNGSVAGNRLSGMTELPAIAGTLAAPHPSTTSVLVVNSTSLPALSTAYNDFYVGLRLRPDVGNDYGTQVDPNYEGSPFSFEGEIDRVVITLKD